ncbi:MAG: zinc ribbon domain-containing protein [Dehalococcoidia bacterium]
MPIYEYACMDCERVVSRLVRRIDDKAKPTCPECGGKKLHRVMSAFAMHLSLMTKLDQLDPKYDKMIDAASPDLSFENLVKQYRLDEPIPITDRDRERGAPGSG